MGSQLGSSLVNLGIEQEVRVAVAELAKYLDDLIIVLSNPRLSDLSTRSMGDTWITRTEAGK
ncbi:glycogen/starch/alpha-glucan phosphorylase [Methylicorpusculum oleiharenae]|uniref:glycogen/starch/alpha-glucan phosphorylase n=1 Tax=Methylicorpusculum oleiharenae TaxID=1338687 RepID=UPI001E57EC54|nr:glycogen/starch/alpha-glucan phosphorylase [Methylicorpusculum oleiharenae]MCD2452287.1 glycogen/starch/alpha-glucan phosphorylase [Methylicorpusculum oleiharenae]